MTTSGQLAGDMYGLNFVYARQEQLLLLNTAIQGERHSTSSIAAVEGRAGLSLGGG